MHKLDHNHENLKPIAQRIFALLTDARWGTMQQIENLVKTTIFLEQLEFHQCITAEHEQPTLYLCLSRPVKNVQLFLRCQRLRPVTSFESQLKRFIPDTHMLAFEGTRTLFAGKQTTITTIETYLPKTVATFVAAPKKYEYIQITGPLDTLLAVGREIKETASTIATQTMLKRWSASKTSKYDPFDL